MPLRCNANGLPGIDRAGEYPLLNPTYDFCYKCPTHCLHLYNYGGNVRIDGEEFAFVSGDITCTPAGIELTYSVEAPGTHWVVHFLDPIAAGDPVFELPHHISLGTHGLFFREQAKLISRLSNTPTPTSRNRSFAMIEAAHRLKAMLLSLHSLMHESSQGRRAANFVWAELLDLIDTEFANQISTSWLAKKMNIAPATLSQKFKAQYGCTVNQYIQKKRIDKARSLLTTSVLSIKEIGSAVGIPDPQYFNKQFRAVMGISPSKYRKQNRFRIADIEVERLTQDGHWRSPESTE